MRVSVSVKNWRKDSVKAHTREEGNRGTIVVDEPLIVLLKDILTRAAMLSENSIKTAFGGSSAPAAIEQFNPGLTDASNQVTMQEHIAGVGIRNHLSIVQLEVNTSGDGFVHLAFDLPHESVENGMEWRRWVVPSPSCGYNTGSGGCPQGGLCHLFDCHTLQQVSEHFMIIKLFNLCFNFILTQPIHVITNCVNRKGT